MVADSAGAERDRWTLSRPSSPSISSSASSAPQPSDHWGADHQHYHGGRTGALKAGSTASARGVKCGVDVVSWQERRVLASVPVAANIDTLWQVITDYERLADFIPNLVQSGTIPCPHEGGYGLSREACSKCCTGTLRHQSCWISKKSRTPWVRQGTQGRGACGGGAKGPSLHVRFQSNWCLDLVL